MSAEATDKALQELERLGHMSPAAPEYSVIRTFLDWLVDLPWQTATSDVLDLREAARILDEDHYGLTKIKERVLEFLAVRKLVEQARGRSCASAAAGRRQDLHRQVHRARHGPRIHPHLPGRRARRGRDPRPSPHLHRRPARPHHPGLRRVKSNNPVFMIDEVDKLGVDFRGDPPRAAGGARSRAERFLPRSLPRGRLRPLARDVHRHRQ